MTEDEVRQMIDTVTACALADKAMLACFLAGVPVTVENVSLAVAPWINPNSIHSERLALSVLGHVESTLKARDRLSPSAATH